MNIKTSVKNPRIEFLAGVSFQRHTELDNSIYLDYHMSQQMLEIKDKSKKNQGEKDERSVATMFNRRKTS